MQILPFGQILEQHLQRRQLVVMKSRRGNPRVRHAHRQVRLDALRFESCGTLAETRLLDEEDAVVVREAGHQVLRSLEDEFPAQVGKDDEIGWARHGRSGGMR
jgi:hypothetical protein